MTMNFGVRNAHLAYPDLINALELTGIREQSRNGPVISFPWPVTIQYCNPRERVVMWPERDANPFFHLFESLWMLAGRNDVAFPASILPTFKQFSDDGVYFNGAYGFRWRKYFGHDQLDEIVSMLLKDKTTRRAYLAMWDGANDLGSQSKDIPCNVGIGFRIVQDRLDMTVHNRSNDLIWGALGANCVHMSMLQEYIASQVGVQVGSYFQQSINLHAYTNAQYDKVKPLRDLIPASVYDQERYNPYHDMKPYPILDCEPEIWDQDNSIFLDEGPITGFRSRFFRRVVTPMWQAFWAYKDYENKNRFADAILILDQCEAHDWRRAAKAWLKRRWEKHTRAQDDGPVQEDLEHAIHNQGSSQATE